MTTRRPPTSDQFLVAWFEDGPTTMPDRVIDVVTRRISRQPQQRSWRLVGRHSVTTTFKWGAVAAALVVLAVVGFNVLPRDGVGGPPPSASPAPTSAPTPTLGTAPTARATAAAVTCDNGSRGCLGPLAAGTYSSANFKPTLTYTMSASQSDRGWANTLDLSRTYSLRPPGGTYTFQVISEIAIPDQTPDCTGKQKAGAGTTVADWVEFVTTHPGLDAEAPKPVIVGGFSGLSVRFARASTWTATCPGSVGPAIEVFLHPGVPDPGIRIVDDQQETFTFLDVSGETVLIIVESGPTPAEHTANLAAAQPIIDTFQFMPR